MKIEFSKSQYKALVKALSCQPVLSLIPPHNAVHFISTHPFCSSPLLSP
jgi:hypothetical protein